MRKWILRILIAIFAAAFVISGYMLLNYQLESSENEDLYEDLAAIVDEVRATIPTEPETTAPAQSNVTTEPTAATEPVILPEYQAVYAMNSDLVGWIRIDGTKINYPVLQTPDTPNYYIDHNFEKESSRHGAIYVQEQCQVDAPSDNIVIFGHRMNDGSMFADLLKYKDKAYFESHKYVQFDTLYQRQTYEIIAVFQIKSVDNNTFTYHKLIDFQNETQFNTYMTRIDLLSLYDTGATAWYGDRLITLSTCEKNYSNGRLVVVAKQIEN